MRSYSTHARGLTEGGESEDGTCKTNRLEYGETMRFVTKRVRGLNDIS